VTATHPSPVAALGAEQGRTLIELAKAAVYAALDAAPAVVAESGADWLQAPAASFVTLTLEGELRGCMGTLSAYRSLEADVRGNALAAAFSDPRFAPVSVGELARLRFEVSVLSALTPLTVRDEAASARALRPGVDGLVLGFGPNRGTFLPQVWRSIPQPEAFLRALKRKAGLPGDFWEPGITLERYTVTNFTEEGGPDDH